MQLHHLSRRGRGLPHLRPNHRALRCIWQDWCPPPCSHLQLRRDSHPFLDGSVHSPPSSSMLTCRLSLLVRFCRRDLHLGFHPRHHRPRPVRTGPILHLRPRRSPGRLITVLPSTHVTAPATNHMSPTTREGSCSAGRGAQGDVRGEEVPLWQGGSEVG